MHIRVCFDRKTLEIEVKKSNLDISVLHFHINCIEVIQKSRKVIEIHDLILRSLNYVTYYIFLRGNWLLCQITFSKKPSQPCK